MYDKIKFNDVNDELSTQPLISLKYTFINIHKYKVHLQPSFKYSKLFIHKYKSIFMYR